MQRHCLPLILCSLPFLAAATAFHSDRSDVTSSLGGWESITDLSDPHVREIGEFAVNEYDRQTNNIHRLKLKSILRGQRQVVSGINYRLVLAVTEGELSGVVKKYLAVVYERPAEKYKKLAKFMPLLNATAAPPNALSNAAAVPPNALENLAAVTPNAFFNSAAAPRNA